MAKEELAIVINAKDGFSDTFSKLSQETRKSESAMKKAEAGSKVFLGALVGLGAAAAAYATHATLTAARTETLGVAMYSIARATGTSFDELDKQEKMMKKQGITTQKARGILARFMQSELDVAEASKVARVAQDLAVISGQNSSEAARDLTDAIATQEVMLLRQYGIVTTSTQIFDEYGATIGKTGKELTETEKKQAFLNKILKEGKKVAGTYETAMESAGKKLTSFPRYFEEAANAIGSYFVPALNSGIDTLAEFLQSITVENIDAFIKRVKDMPIPLYAMAGAITGAVTPALHGMATAAWAAYAPLIPFIAAGTAIGTVAGSAALATNKLYDSFGKVGGVIGTALLPPVGGLVASYRNLEDTTDDVTIKNKYLKTALELIGIETDKTSKKTRTRRDALEEIKQSLREQAEQEKLTKQAMEEMKTQTERNTEALQRLTEARQKDRDAQYAATDAGFALRQAILDEADAYDAWIKIQERGKQETREGQRALLNYEQAVERRKRAEIEASETTEEAMATSKEAVDAYVDNWIEKQNVPPEIAEEIAALTKKWLTGEIPDDTIQSYIMGIIASSGVPPEEANKIATEVLENLKKDATSEGTHIDTTLAEGLNQGRSKQIADQVAQQVKGALGVDAFAEGQYVGDTFGSGLSASLARVGRNVVTGVQNTLARIRTAGEFYGPAPQLGMVVPGASSQTVPIKAHGGEGILTSNTMQELRTLGIPINQQTTASIASEIHTHVFLDGREVAESVNYHNSGIGDNL